ncbi:MAG: SGNH/GDSL hydrolase family protein [Flavobacterium sp.]|jgi:lysophospholipase L1-like esterase|nr:SGNH/GDSL hydrolase family protein [Flavobacterium sp.]
MIKNFKWVVLVSLTFMACTNDDTVTTGEAPVTAGTADFSKYVALGDSFAAGFSDGALFKKGQENSYPNLLAQQFAAAGGGVFSSPFMAADNVGGFSAGGVQVVSPRLYLDTATNTPTPVTGVSANTLTERLTGSFNNMGIPGAKSFHLLFNGYAPLNPYFKRMASSLTATVLGDALAQNPTFFSLWIGGNDALGYSLNGGVPTSQDAVNGNDLTPTATFTASYNALATQLSASGRKGVVANLPYVTALPYFTTVPFNAVPLNAATATQLNSGYAQYNGGLALAQNAGLITAAERTRRTITFAEGQNAVVMVDSYLTNLSALGLPSFRQATSADLLVLPSRSIIGTAVGGNPAQVNGVSVPLEDKWVLSSDEIVEVKAATDAYNLVIQAAATANNLAFVDAKTVMDQLSTTGLNFNTYNMTSTYVTGGSFSLDGFHPSARGYALITNLFIDAINAKYGSTLKKKDGRDFEILYPRVIN